MSLIDGEQLLGTTMVVNGAHVAAGSAVVKSAATASGLTAYKFTAAYTLVWHGAHIAFKRNQTYILDAAEATALLAASAPMVAQ